MAKTDLSILIVGPRSVERDACGALLRRSRFRIRTLEPYERNLHSRSGAQPSACIAICRDWQTATHEIGLYRELWPETPLLALDATPGATLVAPLLDAGADDVVGPRVMAVQLVPRVRALLRRRALIEAPSGQVPLVAGGLRMDLGAHQVWSGGRELALSPTEFRILQKLCMHAGRVVPHGDILTAVWGEQRPEMAESLRVYIRHIRRKVHEAGQAVTIVTRPGIGYMLAIVA